VDSERHVPIIKDISRGAKLGVAVLLVLVLLVGAGNLFATYNEVNSFRQQITQQEAVQRAASRVLEEKLCTTLARLAGLKAPAGNGSTNPSRLYEQQQHDVLAQLAPDVGCPAKLRLLRLIGVLVLTAEDAVGPRPVARAVAPRLAGRAVVQVAGRVRVVHVLHRSVPC
jgi:hypothetical protein